MTRGKVIFLAAALAVPARAAATDATAIAPESVVSAFSGSSSGSGVAGYLQSAHMAAVVAVAAIAVVMVIWGAVEVFGESVWGKKKGRERIWNAILGLLLAAGSYVILKTVSESLLSADFALSSALGSDASPTTISAGTVGSGGTTGTSNNSPGSSSNILSEFSPESGSAAEAIAQAAEYAAANQVNTCNYTAGGRTSCAYAVNDIVQAATGQQVGGGGSTSDMYDVLQTSSSFDQVSGGLANSQRGDIVISPTNSSHIGHVGIVTQTGGAQIVSNSSSKGSVQQNYTASSWSGAFASSNGVYVFRPTGSVNTD